MSGNSIIRCMHETSVKAEMCIERERERVVTIRIMS